MHQFLVFLAQIKETDRKFPGIWVEKNASNLKLMGVRFGSISGFSSSNKKTGREFPGLWVEKNAANLRPMGVRFAPISGFSSSNQRNFQEFEWTRMLQIWNSCGSVLLQFLVLLAQISLFTTILVPTEVVLQTFLS